MIWAISMPLSIVCQIIQNEVLNILVNGELICVSYNGYWFVLELNHRISRYIIKCKQKKEIIYEAKDYRNVPSSVSSNS